MQIQRNNKSLGRSGRSFQFPWSSHSRCGGGGRDHQLCSNLLSPRSWFRLLLSQNLEDSLLFTFWIEPSEHPEFSLASFALAFRSLPLSLLCIWGVLCSFQAPHVKHHRKHSGVSVIVSIFKSPRLRQEGLNGLSQIAVSVRAPADPQLGLLNVYPLTACWVQSSICHSVIDFQECEVFLLLSF